MANHGRTGEREGFLGKKERKKKKKKEDLGSRPYSMQVLYRARRRGENKELQTKDGPPERMAYHGRRHIQIGR
jgi:hypothetical protein